jgi:hypothetical protein
MNRSARVLALASPATPRMAALLGTQLLLLLALARPAYPAASTVLELSGNSPALFGGSAPAPSASSLPARLAADAAARRLATNNLDWHVDTSPARAPGQRVHLAVYDGQSREMDGRVHFSWRTNGAAAGIDMPRPQTDPDAANAKLVVLR